MPELSPELRAALEEHGRPANFDIAAQAEQERADLLRRFPVEVWPSMRLENYALGSAAEPVPYCAMLEYRTPHLGSIKGGSARKHIIYRRKSGQWWLAAPLEGLEPLEAWERLRAQFAGAITAAIDGRLDEIARFELLNAGPALVTKTLAVYAPDQFLRIYSADHLRWFIKLFGATPEPDASSWQLNRQLKHLVEEAEPFTSWDLDEVARFLYGHLDPRADEQIMKIAPGDNARLWSRCLAEGTIRIGWDALPDLREFTTEDDLLDALDANYPENAGKPYHRKLTRQLLRFRDLPAGARVVANKGTSEVLAVGTVTEDGYRYDAAAPEYRHVLGVDWDTSYAQQLATPVRGWVPTFNNVSAEQWATIVRGRAGAGPASLDAPRDPTPVPQHARQLLDALERKGQVIVHGPPGTGKTRLALTAALVLTGRADAAVGTAKQRSDAVQDMLEADESLPQVVMTTFHPSLGYEDFVEGYKPVPTEHGGLALALRDGLFLRICDAAHKRPDQRFVLIIDEINRADLARVLGELITLLERDKRDKVTARLAVSGRSFSVPSNIWIIGAMNTADRSVAHLDAAVRRRFGFVAVPPDPNVVEATVNNTLNLASLLSELNQRITRYLNRDHQLGHALLMADDAPVDSPAALAAALYQDIIPLLEDYALGDPALLAQLLGPDLAANGEIVRLDPEDLLGILAKEFGAGETTIGG